MTIIAINTSTSGKYTKQKIAGRDHIVTSMRPIRGDIAMNGIYYHNSEVKKSYTQLNNLIAPSSHPRVNGAHVSAYHPIAINANNIGGYVKNPRMKGKEVIVDFMLDLEVANQSENGKELIRRIENSERVEVSTGLNIELLVNESGVDDFNKPYDKAGYGFRFDHVAILLNEASAGGHAGTELMLNNDQFAEPVLQANLDESVFNDLSISGLRDAVCAALKIVEPTAPYFYLSEIFPGTNRVIYEIDEVYYQRTYSIGPDDVVNINDDRKPVIKQVEFKTQNNEVMDVDKTKLIDAIIANSASGFVETDRVQLTALNESELAALIAKKREADADYIAFQNHKSEFEAYKASIAKESEELRASIIANSEWTAELLASKPLVELRLLANMASGKSKTAVRLPGHSVANQENKQQASFD